MRPFCCHPVTLEELLSYTVEEGDCRIWTRAAMVNTYPKVHRCGGQYLVRRLVFELTKRMLKRGETVGARCEVPRCIEPEHMVAQTQLALNRKVGAKGRSLTTKARIAQTRRQQSRFSEELIAQVKASTGPAPATAEQFGVSLRYVYALRAGEVRRDYHASPWSGLGGLSR